MRTRGITGLFSRALLAGGLLGVGLVCAAAEPGAADPAVAPGLQDTARQAESVWAGAYASAQGVRLTLDVAEGGAFTGDLVVPVDGTDVRFPVRLGPTGDGGLSGEFTAGASSFPLSVKRGPGAHQLILTSEGNVYELERQDVPRNPLAGARDKPERAVVFAAPVPGANFHHPDGTFSLRAPPAWRSEMHAPDIIQFDTSVPEEVVLVLVAQFEAHEIGQSLSEILPAAEKAVDEFLGPSFELSSNARAASRRMTPVGALTGAISQRTAEDGGNQMAVWQGTVVQVGSAGAVMLVAVVPQRRLKGLTPLLESTFASLRIHRLHRAEDFGGQVEGNAEGQRDVVFNGTRLDAAVLAQLEGPLPLIPDGQYWYDKRSGMAGTLGGPTLAYFAAGLAFCGPLAANASGGGTAVAVNGRSLHPQDLAGLQAYFGFIQPGRYWMDGQGNYGFEGGMVLGNLVQEISALQSQVAQGQAGVGGGQGGYDGSGGSVYRYFPNLGSSGTGVSVADVGGGDTIVNAGGVLWWPGK